jgi:hypothetical protein
MVVDSGCFVPMCWAENQADSMCFAISLEEVAIVARQWRKKEQAAGVASRWRDSAELSSVRTHGTPSHVPRGKPTLMKLISMPMLSSETTRKKGSEAVASARGAPRRCVSSRSSEDYAARGGRGDPRGRKPGAGLGATNPR